MWQIEITTRSKNYGLTMASNFVDKSTYFVAKSIEFVSKCPEKKNLFFLI